MNKNLEISTAPEQSEHTSSFFTRKPRHIYGDQLLFLLALLGMAVVKSGTRSLGLAISAVLISVIVDVLCCYVTRKVYNPRDISTLTSGLCLALMSPATLPYSLVIFGAALAIGIKHIFGGKDNYIFNPTAVAFAFLIICYPEYMLLFPNAGEILPIFGNTPVPTNVGLENHLLRMGEFPVLSALDMLLGNFPGAIGTTHVLIIIISAVCLLFRRSVSFTVTVSCLSVITIFRLLSPMQDDIIGALVREIFGGYLLFALLFLAGDPQTLPKTIFGKLYYGVLLGVLTVLFKGNADGVFTGRVEGWFIFALLIANAFSCRMDIIAERVSDGFVRLSASIKSYLSAYEYFSDDAKSGKIFEGDITATMEIDLALSDYDMPKIDNKVIKVDRKKRNVLTFVTEFPRSLREIAKPKAKTEENLVINNGGEAKYKQSSDSFIIASFKSLFDSIKSGFRRFSSVFGFFGKLFKSVTRKITPLKAQTPEKSGTAEPEAETDKPASPDVLLTPSEIEKESNIAITITDFSEIADTVAIVEAKIEAETVSENKSENKNENEAEETTDPNDFEISDDGDILEIEDIMEIIYKKSEGKN